MKTIDDLLKHAQDAEEILPGKGKTSFDLVFDEDLEPKREVVFHTSKEGHIALQEALRQAALEDKELIWAKGRQCGKSDTILAMQMAMIGQAEEQRIHLMKLKTQLQNEL